RARRTCLYVHLAVLCAGGTRFAPNETECRTPRGSAKEQKMEESGIKEQVLREIREIAEKYGVKKVILFGSRARGDFRRTSDIDLAVSGGDFARFALDVDEETSTLLMFDIVDF